MIPEMLRTLNATISIAGGLHLICLHRRLRLSSSFSPSRSQPLTSRRSIHIIDWSPSALVVDMKSAISGLSLPQLFLERQFTTKLFAPCPPALYLVSTPPDIEQYHVSTAGVDLVQGPGNFLGPREPFLFDERSVPTFFLLRERLNDG